MLNVSQPFSLKGHSLKNRIAKGAMSEALATADGRVTPKLLTLYETWAKGGVALNITGNVLVDANAKNEPGVVVIEDRRDLAALKQWAIIGKRHHTIQIVQLSHAGRQAPKGLNSETVAPSAVPFSPALASFFATPRALETHEIESIIQRFVTAAQVCEEAGFEGVQLHGAHGYLISQFLSPTTNIRTDKWGGTIENRMRFVTEIYTRIRKATQPNFIVGIKLNSADFQKGGATEEEALAVFKHLDSLGIDFIEVSGGTYESPAMTGVKHKKASTAAREAYFLEFAEKARKEVKTALMVTGGFRTRAAMDHALQSGACDLIGVARPFAVQTDIANQLVLGNNAKYATQPIKTGVKALDRMGMMEIIWYAAQFKAIGNGKQPNPNLSPLKVGLGYMLNNIKSVVKRQRYRG